MTKEKDYIVVKDFETAQGLAKNPPKSLRGKYIIVAPDGLKAVSLKTIMRLPQVKSKLEKVIEKVLPYVQHERDCILSQWSAGRRTKDGGYETKFGGKWYQTRPVDKTPKCECGLDKAVDDLKKLKNEK